MSTAAEATSSSMQYVRFGKTGLRVSERKKTWVVFKKQSAQQRCRLALVSGIAYLPWMHVVWFPNLEFLVLGM